MRTVVAVVAVLTLSLLGTLAWGGQATRLVAWTFAGTCEAGATAGCVATMPARVDMRWNNVGEDETELRLSVPGAPVWLGYHDAERLGAEEGDEVTVTLFDGDVTALARGGRTVDIEGPPGQAALRFLLLAAVAAGALVLASRRRGWAVRAAVCAVTGALAGVAAAAAVPPEWVAPALSGLAIVVGVGLSYVRLPRTWTAKTPTG